MSNSVWLSNDGGGGERVLWRAIDALQQLDTQNKIDIVIYSGDKNVSDQDILDKAYVRSNFAEPNFLPLLLSFLLLHSPPLPYIRF